jgi:hypothetical protein
MVWLSNLHNSYKTNPPEKYNPYYEKLLAKLEEGTYVIGPPQQSMIYSQQKLEEMGMVGVYLKD